VKEVPHDEIWPPKAGSYELQGNLQHDLVMKMLAAKLQGMRVKSAGATPTMHGMRFVVEMERYAEL
jgi:hypothetical protein